MQSRFGRYAVIWVLLVLSIYVGDRIIRDTVLTEDVPRAVTPRGALAPFEQTIVQIFQQAAPSVVYIFTPGPHGTGGAGSGFVWDQAGHVVTNVHVVDGASRVAVRLDDGETIGATVVGKAPDYDLAVIRLDETRSALRPIPLGRSQGLKVGQTVLAIGNPFGLSRTLTTGIISALNRRLPTASNREVAGVIQTDAAINPGNSGGPLLDSAGRLIGVNTAILSGTGSNAGVGFAVPVDLVNDIVPQLIRQGSVPRPGIGITVMPEEAAAQLNVKGLVIAEVLPGSPADRAGLRGVDQQARRLGDVILKVGDTPVQSIAKLADELRKVGIGNRAELTVLRNGTEQIVEVEVTDIS